MKSPDFTRQGTGAITLHTHTHPKASQTPPTMLDILLTFLHSTSFPTLIKPFFIGRKPLVGSQLLSCSHTLGTAPAGQRRKTLYRFYVGNDNCSPTFST